MDSRTEPPELVIKALQVLAEESGGSLTHEEARMLAIEVAEQREARAAGKEPEPPSALQQELKRQLASRLKKTVDQA